MTNEDLAELQELLSKIQTGMTELRELQKKHYRELDESLKELSNEFCERLDDVQSAVDGDT